MCDVHNIGGKGMYKAKWKKHLAAVLSMALLATPMTASAATTAGGGPVLNAVADASDATAMALAKALVGDGVTVVSAKMEGSSDSFGSFSGAGNIVGFDEGLVISTGRTEGIFSNGSQEHFSTLMGGEAFMGSEKIGFDADKNFYDYTMLEFTYIPTEENVSFQYGVASEEYPEYIDFYFDQFVLLVNGVNYALVPGTGELVTIGTVNHNNNAIYYRGLGDSAGSVAISDSNFVFDGMTTVFSVSAAVNPGVENTICVAIADRGDSVFDSAVFIKAGSVKEKEATPGEITASGINDGSLELDRNDGSDGFVAVDVTFQDVNKNTIGTESVTFDDGETNKNVKVPENTVYFFITATAGDVTVAPTVSTPQNIEEFEAATEYSVSGSVIAETKVFNTVSSGNAVSVSDGNAEELTEMVAGAEVSIKGNGVSKTTLTDETGNFVFKNLKQGVYQIRVTKDGKSGSAIVKVDVANVNCTVELHNGSDTVDTGDTGIMVGGLNELLNADSPIMDEDDKAVIAAGGSLSVNFMAGLANADDIAALEAATGQTFNSAYELTISKTAKDASGAEKYTKPVTETGKMIDIVMPISDDMKDMSEFAVYRVHNGATEAITTTPNEAGEYIEVLKKEGVVIVHVSKFSTYALKGTAQNVESENDNNQGESQTSDTGKVLAPKTGETTVSTMFWVVMATMFVAAVAFGKKAFVRKNETE